MAWWSVVTCVNSYGASKTEEMLAAKAKKRSAQASLQPYIDEITEANIHQYTIL